MRIKDIKLYTLEQPEQGEILQRLVLRAQLRSVVSPQENGSAKSSHGVSRVRHIFVYVLLEQDSIYRGT